MNYRKKMSYTLSLQLHPTHPPELLLLSFPFSSGHQLSEDTIIDTAFDYVKHHSAEYDDAEHQQREVCACSW